MVVMNHLNSNIVYEQREHPVQLPHEREHQREETCEQVSNINHEFQQELARGAFTGCTLLSENT